jgi:5-methylcytosine-specific restriction endonuclease McrA
MGVIDWQRAMTLILDDRVELVEHYVGRVLRSVSVAYPWPAVVRLRRFSPARTRLRFNRAHVFARDSCRCQYCGERPRVEDLTIDHVIPRAQARGAGVRLPSGRTVPVTCWENVVTACFRCNRRKADRTPEQAGMRLLAAPRVPNSLDVLRMSLQRTPIAAEWREYLPMNSEWRDYWTVELDPA